MRWIFGLAVVAALAVTGLTACTSGDGNERRSAALASGAATGAQPFQSYKTTGTIAAGDAAENSYIIVPAGKLLVIEHISGSISLPDPQHVFQMNLSTKTGTGAAVEYRLKNPVAPPSDTGSTSSTSFGFSEEVTLYANPGTYVYFTVFRSPYTTGTWVFSWALSGYLIDA